MTSPHDERQNDSVSQDSPTSADPRDVGGGQVGLGTDPAGSAGTVDRTDSTGTESTGDTPLGSLGSGLDSDADR